MANGKLSIEGLIAEDAAYVDQKLRFSPTPYTASSVEFFRSSVDVGTSSKFLAYGTFSNSADLLAIKNNGTSDVYIQYWSSGETVSVGSDTLAFDSSADTITVSGGATDLTDSLKVGDYVVVSATGLNSANTGTANGGDGFLICDLTSTVITVQKSLTLVTETGKTGGALAIRYHNTAKVPAGGMLIVSESINALPVKAISASGTNPVSVFYWGT